MRSRAQENPPSVAVHLSWPSGGSPRRARMFVIPASLHLARALWIFSTSIFVHVRCMLGFSPNCSLAFTQRSTVSSLVLPPAPQVKSVKRGSRCFNFSITLSRLSNPACVLGGKNYKTELNSTNYGTLTAPG